MKRSKFFIHCLLGFATTASLGLGMYISISTNNKNNYLNNDVESVYKNFEDDFQKYGFLNQRNLITAMENELTKKHELLKKLENKFSFKDSNSNKKISSIKHEIDKLEGEITEMQKKAIRTFIKPSLIELVKH